MCLCLIERNFYLYRQFSIYILRLHILSMCLSKVQVLFTDTVIYRRPETKLISLSSLLINTKIPLIGCQNQRITLIVHLQFPIIYLIV